MEEIPEAPESEPVIVSPSPLAREVGVLPKRDEKAWKTRKRKENARGAGRGKGAFIEPPADAKKAKAMVQQLALEATKAIAEGKKFGVAEKEAFERMTATTRAHILSYLGEDVEAARAEFANELMANARKCAQKLMANFDDLPPSVQSFVFTTFIDKSDVLRTKAMTSSAGAAVGQMVNVFLDGSVDRETIMKQLTGQAFTPAPEVKKVEAVPVG